MTTTGPKLSGVMWCALGGTMRAVQNSCGRAPWDLLPSRAHPVLMCCLVAHRRWSPAYCRGAGSLLWTADLGASTGWLPSALAHWACAVSPVNFFGYGDAHGSLRRVGMTLPGEGAVVAAVRVMRTMNVQ